MKRVILDSNLLLLLVVGIASRDYISQHRRLRSYRLEDFDLLVSLLDKAAGLVLTPNTLTETSNLVDRTRNPHHADRIAHTLQILEARWRETYVASSVGLSRPEYGRLGLTDAILLELGSSETVLLTADLDLYLAAVQVSINAINFNHLRDLAT